MEFSEIFGFLTILKESIKLLFRNWKFTAPTITISLFIPSILLVSFVRFSQIWTDGMTASTTGTSTSESDFSPILYALKYLAPMIAVEIVFLLVWLTIARLSGITTVLISASSYTGKQLSFKDLVSSVKKKWRRNMNTILSESGQSTYKYLFVFGILASFLLSMFLNPITISVAIILWSVWLVCQIYESVVRVLSIVVCVVEESYQGKEAADRARQLADGQRVHGFMINLLIHVVFAIVLLVCWICLGVPSSTNLMIYGLVSVNFISLIRIFASVAYTVFYFWCKRCHGEEIESAGDLPYTKLPSSEHGGDLPYTKLPTAVVGSDVLWV